ncbi:hypothetical protein FGB62_23g232 [Gracilaria domingensis]|nr:hypothetical protein FGB62_23g232 [Gracilaria domingensis]
MYNYGCSFVNYLTIGTAKRCFCGRQLYDVCSLAIHSSASRGTNKRIEVSRRYWSNSRHQLWMKTGNEDNETFRALELDIKTYLASLSEVMPNPLSYVNLRKAGRIDLVSRIVDAGGYIEVSKWLGVPVDETQFVPPPEVSEGERFEPFSKPDDQRASIAIGRSLEERMKSIDELANRDEPSKFVIQPPNLSRIEEVPSAAELVEQNNRIAPRVVDEPSIEGENLSLTIPMRLGLLTLTIVTALGFGKTSSFVMSSDVISTSQSVAGGLTLAHSLLAFYCALVVAPRMNRSSILWFIKVLLGGPLAVVELRSLDGLEASE